MLFNFKTTSSFRRGSHCNSVAIEEMGFHETPEYKRVYPQYPSTLLHLCIRASVCKREYSMYVRYSKDRRINISVTSMRFQCVSLQDCLISRFVFPIFSLQLVPVLACKFLRL